MVEYLAIPKGRVAVLIGESGEVKSKVEHATGVKLEISGDGHVTIDDSNASDSLLAWKARDIVKAIGRGFIPSEALQLLNEDYVLEVIDLEQLLPNEKAVSRQKSRLIGTGGRMRKFMESNLNILISIYGNTIGFIGLPEDIAVAKECVEKLLNGAMHSTVFKFIERKMQTKGV